MLDKYYTKVELYDTFQTLDELSNYIANVKSKTNCPNCGAPVKGCKCEYCETVFL